MTKNIRMVAIVSLLMMIILSSQLAYSKKDKICEQKFKHLAPGLIKVLEKRDCRYVFYKKVLKDVKANETTLFDAKDSLKTRVYLTAEKDGRYYVEMKFIVKEANTTVELATAPFLLELETNATGRFRIEFYYKGFGEFYGKDIGLYYLKDGEWIKAEKTGIDHKKKVIWAEVNHLSVWTVGGKVWDTKSLDEFKYASRPAIVEIDGTYFLSFYIWQRVPYYVVLKSDDGKTWNLLRKTVALNKPSYTSVLQYDDGLLYIFPFNNSKIKIERYDGEGWSSISEIRIPAIDVFVVENSQEYLLSFTSFSERGAKVLYSKCDSSFRCKPHIPSDKDDLKVVPPDGYEIFEDSSPSIVYSGDKYYLLFSAKKVRNADVFYIKSKDGEVWKKPKKVVATIENEENPRAFVNSLGKVIFVWSGKEERYGIYYRVMNKDKLSPVKAIVRDSKFDYRTPYIYEDSSGTYWLLYQNSSSMDIWYATCNEKKNNILKCIEAETT